MCAYPHDRRITKSRMDDTSCTEYLVLWWLVFIPSFPSLWAKRPARSSRRGNRTIETVDSTDESYPEIGTLRGDR